MAISFDVRCSKVWWLRLPYPAPVDRLTEIFGASSGAEAIAIVETDGSLLAGEVASGFVEINPGHKYQVRCSRVWYTRLIGNGQHRFVTLEETSPENAIAAVETDGSLLPDERVTGYRLTP